MKAQMVVLNNIVPLVLIIIVALLLLGLMPSISRIVINAGSDTTCEASFMAASLTHIMGGSPIEPRCKTNLLTLTVSESETTDEGEEKKALARNYPSSIQGESRDTFTRIKEWNQEHTDAKYPYFEQEDISIETTDYEEKKRIAMRYNMDMILSEEMRRCWDIAGQGKLKMFDNWFNMVDCEPENDGFQKCESEKEAIARFAGNIVDCGFDDIVGDGCDYDDLTDDDKLKLVANFCVLCSRVKFSPEVNHEFMGIGYEYDPRQGYDPRDVEAYDLANWMANNPIPVAAAFRGVGGTKTKSYYEYIFKEEDTIQEDFSSFKFEPQNIPYVTDEPYAVVFIRSNFHAAFLYGLLGAYRWIETYTDKSQWALTMDPDGLQTYRDNPAKLIGAPFVIAARSTTVFVDMFIPGDVTCTVAGLLDIIGVGGGDPPCDESNWAGEIPDEVYWSNYLILMPYDEVSRKCDYVVGTYV